MNSLHFAAIPLFAAIALSLGACGDDSSSSAQESENYCHVSRSGNTITQILQATQLDMSVRTEVTLTFTNTLYTEHKTTSTSNAAKYGLSLENMCKEFTVYTSCKCGTDYFEGTGSIEVNVTNEQKENDINLYMKSFQKECDEFYEEFSSNTPGGTTNYPVTSCLPTLQDGVLTISFGGTNFSATNVIRQENGMFYNDEVYNGFTQEFLDGYYQNLLSEESYINIERNGNTFTYQESANFLGHTATIEDNYTSAQSVCKALLSGEISIEELSL